MSALRPYSSRFREGTNQVLTIPVRLKSDATIENVAADSSPRVVASGFRRTRGGLAARLRRGFGAS
jgi:hypothetical protein